MEFSKLHWERNDHRIANFFVIILMRIVEFCLLNDQTFTLPVGSIVHLMLKRAGHFNYLII